MKSKSDNLSAVVNSSILIFDKIVRIIIGLVVGVLVAKYLGPDRYGQLNYAIAFTTLFGTLTTGFNGIVIKKLILNSEETSNILGSSIVLQLLLGLFAFTISLLFYLFYRGADSQMFILITIFSIPHLFKFTDAFRYYFEAHSKFKTLVLCDFSVLILFSFVKVSLVYFHSSLILIAVATALELITSSLLIYFLFYCDNQKSRKLSRNLKLTKQLFWEAVPLIISSFGIILYMKIDQLMLHEYIGAKAVGVYSAALRFSEGIYFLPMVIMSALTPLLLKKFNNQEQYLSYFQKVLVFLFLISLSFSIFFTFFSNIFVETIYGDSYIEAGKILKVHVWTSIAIFLGVPAGSFFISYNLQRYTLIKTFIGLIFNIFLNVILIPVYGALGAAVSTLISQMFVSIFLNLFFKATRAFFFMQMNCFNIFLWGESIRWIKKLKAEF